MLGIALDCVDMATVLRQIKVAVASRMPLLISTLNLNFLVTSQSDEEFRASLFLSDLCTPDGMPLIWLARLLGIPIRERVAGADLFEALKAQDATAPLKVFLFGGAEGVAAAACDKVNLQSSGLTCVGSYFPGFTSVDEMSSDELFETINSSQADFLVAALGAKKGQAWLLRNHDRIRIPVRAHLGATIGFQAGVVRRAPRLMQKLGLEWLWRIKEEPQLWTRYWNDGWIFLRLMLTRVLPLLILSRRLQRGLNEEEKRLSIERSDTQKAVVLKINGLATARNIEQAIPVFQEALKAKKDILINFRDTRLIDARFLGLLTVVDKHLGRDRLRLAFTELGQIDQILRLSGFELLQRSY